MNPAYVSLDAVCWNVWEQLRRLHGDGIDASGMLRVYEDLLVELWRNELASW